MADEPQLLTARSLMGETAILDVDDVSKSHSTQEDSAHPALSKLSLTVAKGEFISIIGPSGCGKTTLLKICAGLLAPSTGSRWVGTVLTMRRDLLLFVALMFTTFVGIAGGELVKAITDADWTFFLGLAIAIPVWLALHDLITRRRPR